MRIFIVVFSVAIVSSKQIPKDFESFKQQFSKSYKTIGENAYRQSIFEQNVDYINNHNFETERGRHTFTLAVNKFSDLSTDEWRKYLLGMDVHADGEALDDDDGPDKGLPDSVDWRSKGYVTDVKNQGHCGSCWAFSATGSMEGAWFNKTKKLTSLSEQNIVDCDQKSLGCKGGNMPNAFRYVISAGGDDTEASYPYKGIQGTCNFSRSDIGASIKSFKEVKQFDEKALKKAVAEVGPISVAIDASKPSFHHYSNGTYYEEECSSTKLDHGVLAVGYGGDDNGDFWIVKNSWGLSWGMKGYIHMSRNKKNNCGIATDASYPIA